MFSFLLMLAFFRFLNFSFQDSYIFEAERYLCQRKRENLWWTDINRPGFTTRCEKLDYDENKEECGVCGRPSYDAFAGNMTCWHSLFKNRYNILPTTDDWKQRCVILDMCRPSYYFRKLCSNQGKCRPGFGVKICDCPKPYIGMECEETAVGGTEDSYARGIQVFFDARKRVLLDTVIMVAVEHGGDNVEVKITADLIDSFDSRRITEPVLLDYTSKELIQLCEENLHLNYICSMYLKGSTKIYSTTFRFPLVRSSRAWYYVDKNNRRDYPIGYGSSIIVSVVNKVNDKSTEVFRVQHSLFVDYPLDLHCYKSVRITNCPPKQMRYNPSDELYFEATYPNPTFHEPVLEKNERMHCLQKDDDPTTWVIWKGLPNGKRMVIHEQHGETRLTTRPYLLEKGIYSVEFSYSMLAQTGAIENFSQCTFEIVEIPLEAEIKGGSEVTVDGERELLLDGDDSEDPNYDVGLNKEGLEYEWSCKTVYDKRPCLIEYLFLNKKSRLTVPPFMLTTGQQYNISLKISKKGKLSVYTHQVVSVSRGAKVVLQCESCTYYKNQLYANPSEFIIFQAYVTTNTKVNVTRYVWEYSEDQSFTQESYKTTEEIAHSNSKINILKIGKNKLTGKNYYSFRVTIPELFNIYASIVIYVPKIESSCYVYPEEGVRGWTLFNLDCFLNETITKATFELFDKALDDNDYNYSGRMIGTNKDGMFRDFRLTNEKVVVYVYMFKIYVERVLKVTLSEFNGTVQDVNSISDFSTFFTEKTFPSILNTASVIPYILLPRMNRTTITQNLISSVYKVKTIYGHHLDLEDIKLCLSSISYILVKILSEKEPEFTLEADVARMSAETLLELTKALQVEMPYIKSRDTLTDNIAYDMQRTVLNTVEIVLAEKNAIVLSKPLYLVNQFLLTMVQETSRDLVETLYVTSDILLLQQLSGSDTTELTSKKSNIIALTVVDQPGEVRTEVINNSLANILFSDVCYQRLHKSTKTLGLYLTTIYINPFWWGSSNINTIYVLILRLWHKVEVTQYVSDWRPTKTECDIQFYFNISEHVSSLKYIEGQTTQLDSKSSTSYDLDLKFTVYRFDPPLRARMFVRFEFPNGSEEFRVLFTVNSRPDYDMMMDPNTTLTISRESPVYNLTYERELSDKLYYMGILPGKNVAQNTTIGFKVRVYYTHCKKWLEFSWGNLGCWVGKNTNDHTLECDCSKFSMFGGMVQVPPYLLNPAAEYELFLTETVNWLPLLVFIVVVITYLLVCVWGLIKDKKNRNKGIIMLLEDNYPNEKFAYLLGIYTGSRFRAGTTSKVGIKLHGAAGESRSHILRSSFRKTLQGNTDDWFLMYSPTHFGVLKSMEMWHDNSGSSPDWFVEQVLVYDLFEQFQYIFEINVWIDLGTIEFPDVYVTPSSLEKYQSVRRVFHDNVINGLRDTHTWTSVLWKHPRNPVSRVERITTILCFTAVAMSFSMMLYIFFNGTHFKEDAPNSHPKNIDFVIFFITFLAASTASGILMALIRKSYSYKYTRVKASLFFKHKNTTISKSGSILDQRRPSFLEITESHFDKTYLNLKLRRKATSKNKTYEHFASVVHALIRGSSLEPVRMPNYKSSLKVNWKLLIVERALCLAIVLLFAVLVILYGVRLPYVIGHKWLTVFLSVVLFDAIVFSTFKTIFFSAIVSVMFRKLVPISNYQVQASDGMQKHLHGDKEHLFKLLETRCQGIYCRIHEKKKKEFRRILKTRQNWKLVIEFIVNLFLILFLLLLSILTHINNFRSNSHAAFMLTHNHFPKYSDFVDILNRTHYEDFFTHSFMFQLYKTTWYNDGPLDTRSHMPRKYWTDDSVMTLLGSTRIRQLRVRPVPCAEVKGEEISDNCCPSWSLDFEERDVYHTSWSYAGLEDIESSSSAWKFTDPEKSNSSTAYGLTLNQYHPGGYIADLGYDKFDTTIEKIAFLKASNWLDHMTRAVIIELTLYNVNTNKFIQVLLIAEQLHSGQYLTISQVESGGVDRPLDIWNITISLFLVFFFIRTCVLMNRNGIFVYLSVFLNVFQIFLFVLGVCFVVFQFVFTKALSDYVHEFQKRGHDEFFDFNKIITVIYSEQVLFCALFICTVIRLQFFWRFGRIFFTFFYTFLLSFSWVIWLTSSFIILVTVTWRCIGFLLSVFVFHNTNTIVLFHHKEFYDTTNASLSFKTVILVMSALSFLVISLFIASFSYYYKVAKVYKLVNTDSLNIITFTKSELTRKWRRMKS